MDENGENITYTERALTMLQIMLQRIAYEMADNPGKKQDYYNELASVGVYVANTIYQIENGLPVPIEEEDEDEPLNIEFVSM